MAAMKQAGAARDRQLSEADVFTASSLIIERSHTMSSVRIHGLKVPIAPGKRVPVYGGCNPRHLSRWCRSEAACINSVQDFARGLFASFVQLTQDRARKKNCSNAFKARGWSRRNPAQRLKIASDPDSKLTPSQIRLEVVFQGAAKAARRNGPAPARTVLLHCESLNPPMSELGQTRSFGDVGSMSGLP
jgi:hypothetical protein